MRNKADRNDARGIAQLVRLGWFRQVHIKSDEAQRTRMLLSCSLSRMKAQFAYRQQPEQVSFWLVPKAGDRT